MRLSAQGVNVPFRETPAHPVTVIVDQALEPRRLLVRFGARDRAERLDVMNTFVPIRKVRRVADTTYTVAEDARPFNTTWRPRLGAR